MNQEWSELNKLLQLQLKKEATFSEGILTLVTLRKKLFGQLEQFKMDLSMEDFSRIPFINATGYHGKTIAYSIWHIFRIEDIVAHELICQEEQIFVSGDFQNRTHSSIITTGNELVRQQIAEFSKEMDMDELYEYASAVMESTNEILSSLTFADLKRKMREDDKERLKLLGVVSEEESAIWLIDYWCKKDIRGLIQMPFSRHWIMHIEACLRIRNKI